MLKISRAPASHKLWMRARHILPLVIVACYPIPFAGHGWKNEYWLSAAALLLIFPAFMKLRKLESGTANEVFDCRDSLLFRTATLEEYIRLSDIAAIHATGNTRTPKITLVLKRAGHFGTILYFFAKPEPSLNPFAINSVAQSLILRVSDAGGRILDYAPQPLEKTPRKLL
ncbi:MAG: hypothetical protein GX410_00385 [Elusimicrobia bacterium]|nr:hypothetical protein [Elusimicrobiota bacterium]